MLIVDETDWPLVVVRWSMPVCGCDLQRYRARFEHWLRHANFALVSVLEHPVSMPACALRQMAQWMHDRRSLIEQRCVGIASVLPPEMLNEPMAQDHQRKAGAHVGCAAQFFSEEFDAIGWAIQRLRDADSKSWPPLFVPAAPLRRLH